jgi:hypothetical protein
MSFEWQVPVIVLGIIVLVLFFFGRPKDASDQSDQPPSDPELIERLQQTLGIGIVIESIDSMEVGDPVTIRATLMYGGRTTQVEATGESEADARSELAKAAIAWHNTGDHHVPMWPGGG